ncbi:uncharacterized protein LOC144221943 isoform X2 [Crocuta crocuta]
MLCYEIGPETGGISPGIPSSVKTALWRVPTLWRVRQPPRPPGVRSSCTATTLLPLAQAPCVCSVMSSSKWKDKFSSHGLPQIIRDTGSLL